LCANWEHFRYGQKVKGYKKLILFKTVKLYMFSHLLDLDITYETCTNPADVAEPKNTCRWSDTVLFSINKPTNFVC
jgi:hypothetical protein